MSSSFKIKNKKKSPTDNRITLDAQHNEKMKEFQDLSKSVNCKKKKIKILQTEFNILKEKKIFHINRYRTKSIFRIKRINSTTN